MSDSTSRLRQEISQSFLSLETTLRILQAREPMVQGSLYLLRRKCGKPSCHCARGELHASWVLTRSESGKNRIYPVPITQRGTLRPLTRQYRRWQAARARFVRQAAALLLLIDRLAEERLQRWPAPPNP